MTDDKLDKMNISIGKRIRTYLIFYTLLIVVFLWGKNLIGLLNRQDIDLKDSEIISKVVVTIFTFLGNSIMVILNLGRDIDLHNFIDKSFFKVREKTGNIICEKMKETIRELVQRDVILNDSNKDDLFSIFYHFVNDQPVLRSLAFTYWEQYFVNIYMVVISVCYSFFSIIVIVLRYKTDEFSLIPAIFIIIGIVIALYTKYGLLPKIYNLPNKNISQIINSSKVEFIRLVNQKFPI